MNRKQLLMGQMLVVILALISLSACNDEVAPPPSLRTVYALKVGEGQSGPVQGANGASFSGAVQAREQAPLSFRVPGSLLRRTVDVGDAVRGGQVLAVLDAGDQSAQANAIKAQLAAAQAQLQRARADQARYAKLAKDQLISRSTMDAQNAGVAAAQGEVNALQANLKLATNQARYTQLTAPRSGVIAERLAEAGQVVGAGQPIFSLAADGAREVVFAVPETDIAQIRSGMPVKIELWATPGTLLNGTIREVSPIADAQTRTFTARATVTDTGNATQLGQSAKVIVPGLVPRGEVTALSVPLAAVVQSGNTGPAVFVIDPATLVLQRTPVQLGAFGAETVPVTSGLPAGSWIVAAGAHLLRDGQKVTPVDRDNRPVLSAAAKATP